MVVRRVGQQPLQLFLQLNLGALPAELGSTFGTGLLQLFYCTNEACAGEGGWEPFADDLTRVRVVQPNGPSVQALVQYNNQSSLLTSNIRLALLDRSGTGLFIVYNDRRDTTLFNPYETLGRSFIVKYTRLFDF